MTFVEMRNQLIAHFNEMTKHAEHLFEVAVNKDEMWNLYLDSFPAGKNDIFRTRREHDCSCCRHFIKTMGNVVALKNNEIICIWDFTTGDDTYQPVLTALSEYIHSKAIQDVWVNTETRIGIPQNYEKVEGGTPLKWEHFYLDIPGRFVTRRNRLIGEVRGSYRDVRNVFKRSLEEISKESVLMVLELISQNSLYKGLEWRETLNQFLQYKEMYDTTPEHQKENFAWEQSVKAGPVIGKIRNHSIGTLLVNLSEGMDLEEAVKKYEQIVAPANYKRPKAIFSKRMLEEAQKFVEENNYMDSLPRRYATLDDITVNNILFCNRSVASRIAGGNVFAEMAAEVAVNPKKFDKVEEVEYDKFISDVLPMASEVELFLENRHLSNLVSLIAPVNKEAKIMFKWNNAMGWAYTGNVTDSMKERVKAAGGKVDGDLRFSIQWNEDGTDNCDLDAHCKEASGYEIYFSTAKKPHYSPTKGQLDVDIVHPNGNIAVENITWADRKTMKPGKYLFFVHQYSGRAKKGFRAEIEFDGQIYSFDYSKSMRTHEKIPVAEVTLNTDGKFSIKELLPSSASSVEAWGINTNQFIPVTVICNSPNYWDEQQGIGHRHIFFMLKDCVNKENPNGFYNEFLKEEFMQHKNTMEALGGKLAVAAADDQLSGVGFSTTKRNDVLVKVKGQTERVIRIKF